MLRRLLRQTPTPDLTRGLEKREIAPGYRGVSRSTNAKRRKRTHVEPRLGARAYSTVQTKSNAESIKKQRSAKKKQRLDMQRIEDGMQRMNLGGRTKYAVNRLRARPTAPLLLTYKKPKAKAKEPSPTSKSVSRAASSSGASTQKRKEVAAKKIQKVARKRRESIKSELKYTVKMNCFDPIMPPGTPYNNDDLRNYIRTNSMRYIRVHGHVKCFHLDTLNEPHFIKKLVGSVCGPHDIRKSRTFPTTYPSDCCRAGIGGAAAKPLKRGEKTTCESVQFDPTKKFITHVLFDKVFNYNLPNLANRQPGKNAKKRELQRIAVDTKSFTSLINSGHKYWELRPTGMTDYFHSATAVSVLTRLRGNLIGETHGRRADEFAIYKLHRVEKDNL